MNLLLATFPDDPAEARLWLDRQLVSTRLPQLAGELAACHDASTTEASADNLSAADILGEQHSQILTAGTAALSEESFTQLLKRPSLLLGLQADVLAHGGPYWQTIGADSSDLTRQQAGKQQLASWIEAQTNQPSVELAKSYHEKQQTAGRRLMSLLAIAASLLLAGWIGHQTAVPPPPAAAPTTIAWGWAKPDALDTSLDRTAYLESLASAAEAWSKKRPETPEALAKRISEFRQGCSRLILADHKPLPEADATWLKEKCLAWAKKIDAHLLALEEGGDVEAARNAMDVTVEKLIAALQKRSTV